MGRFRRWSRRVPWAPLLWLAPVAALALLLLVSLRWRGSDQINQVPAVASTWRVVFRRGAIDLYHCRAAVPDSAVPLFALLAKQGPPAPGALALGETHHYPPCLSATVGHVHQGGPAGSAPFTRWTLWLREAFFASCVLCLPAAAAVLRHRLNRRRALGLCLKCAYDLTGNVSGICPECGGAVRSATA